MTRRSYVWDEAGESMQLQQWHDALEAANGNITAAGRAMGFSKRWAMRLTERHGLRAYAAELRQKFYGQTKGRFWKDEHL